MDGRQKFWDKMAKGYAKSAIKDQDAYQRKLDATRQYFNSNTKVLEIACGTGTTAISHAPYVHSVLAMDISSNMLEIAQVKAEEANVDNIEFVRSTIEDFDPGKNQFDVAMAHSILHLLEEPELAMSKVYKALKPGGLFVTSTVCLGDGSFIWKLVLPVVRLLGLAPRVNTLTRKELDAHFASVGFEIEDQWAPYKKMTAFIVGRKPDLQKI